jgi:hypothetical protein
MKKILALSILAALASACSSAPVERTDQKVLATGTTDQKLPFWTYEGNVDKKKLAEAMGDDSSSPKHSYFISRATVDNEDLVPNCYQMARTRASAELASGISGMIKESDALASSANASEFEGMINTQTQQSVVGAEVAEKTWAKIERSGAVRFQCWVVLAIPKENVKHLQEVVFEALQKQSSGDEGLKERVKTAMDKMQQTL